MEKLNKEIWQTIIYTPLFTKYQNKVYNVKGYGIIIDRKGMRLKMKETIIKVEGMVCNGCENRVQNALKTIEGVENVIANHKTGTVKVTSKDEVTENIMKEKLEDVGFEVKED